MKVIDAICVTSTASKRQQICFDETTGLIVDVGQLSLMADFRFSDDCLLFAGMGDIHIHAREDVSQKNCYKEDFCSAHSAMINGGVTHAGDMPNNPVPPVDDESYLAKMKLTEKVNGDIWTYAGIGPGTLPLSFKVPYKVYMGPSIGELFFKDLPTLDTALARYTGQWVSFHCEDPEILESSKAAPTHEARRPVKAEVVATKDALMLIEKHKLAGKLCHYSSGEGLELIRAARSRGQKILIEVTPQHLYYSVEELGNQEKKMFQMNPPIRGNKDKEEMLRALIDGEIDFLATDHAPHTQEEKSIGTSGLTGLDTFGPFVTWLILEKKISPQLIARVASENPGNFFNEFLPSWKKIQNSYESFGLGLGHLKPGYRASFTVLNLKRAKKISKENLKTKVGHSPFEGVTFPGSVESVFIGGQKV
jgi:dihydroorotase